MSAGVGVGPLAGTLGETTGRSEATRGRTGRLAARPGGLDPGLAAAIGTGMPYLMRADASLPGLAGKTAIGPRRVAGQAGDRHRAAAPGTGVGALEPNP